MKFFWRHCLSAAMLLGVSHSASALVLEDCHVEGLKEKVQCATLDVAENPQQPTGKQIPLNITVLKGLNATADAVPLLFLAGGPGQAATELTAMVDMMFSEIRQSRDIVLIDQRGTGKSNGLDCSNMETEGLGLDIYFSAEELNEQAKACLESFKQSDLSQYSTNQAIDDFEQVRQALGYKQFYLYGGSYGTRAGLVYMRRYPGSVAGAILDSVAPTQLAVGLFGKTGEQSFDLLLQDCRQTPACAAAFPNLKQDFIALTERMKKAPIKTDVLDPISADKTLLVLDIDRFINLIRTALYSVQTRAMLPLLISEAAKGNYKPFLGLYAGLGVNSAGMYFGLTLTIVCSEDWPRVTPQMLSEDNDNYVVGNNTGNTFENFCKLWPKYPVSPDFAKPVSSDIPTLLLSGRVDPVTPPDYAEMALETLSNARHLVAYNGAHSIISHTCAPKLIEQFLQSGKVSELDDSCLTKHYPSRFLINANSTNL